MIQDRYNPLPGYIFSDGDETDGTYNYYGYVLVSARNHATTNPELAFILRTKKSSTQPSEARYCFTKDYNAAWAAKGSQNYRRIDQINISL